MPESRETESEAPAPDEPTAEASRPAARGWRRWAKLLSRKWVGVLLGASILMHGVVLWYAKSIRDGLVTTAELSLGSFEFVAQDPETVGLGTIRKATFDLHVTLLYPRDVSVRERFAQAKFRLQQDIEELLRRAHGGDFEDPSLAELKRQLQEQVNSTIGMRAVSDVIITGLVIEQDGAPRDPLTEMPARRPAGGDPRIAAESRLSGWQRAP